MSVVISADATDAFSHLLMVGLASILEDANPDRVCLFRWLDDLQAFEIKTNDDLVSIFAVDFSRRLYGFK